MIDKYSARCPKCGSKNIIYDTSMVLTSNPPQHKCQCKDCNNNFFSGESLEYSWTNKDFLDDMWKQDQSILNTPKISDPIPGDSWMPFTPAITDNYGWICPKCGRVMAPNQSYCIFCSQTSVEINTNKIVDNDTLNDLIKQMKETSPSVVKDPFIYGSHITTSTTDENNTYTLKAFSELDDVMKLKFLDESESVMEAVDKYIEWEKNKK